MIVKTLAIAMLLAENQKKLAIDGESYVEVEKVTLLQSWVMET